ncbi:hypothetical protein U5801_20595 [Lamprobacter modestohalophilus]|uniref:hypothetical protein n=1 Tax=Lamprobacter modestohalophilus TaxID=1064514 RepID=UPI002ADEB58F|nr:hypothetical protein [Lamprobacter modestohalophilus]MEA1052188.1 hypothetical protein [Lamprobacter modestohalophilus]
MDATSIGPALLLTLLAGLATAIGSVIAFFAPRAETRFLGIALGFSAGVMIYVSFDVLLPSAETYGEHHPTVYALVAGMMVMALSLLLL